MNGIVDTFEDLNDFKHFIVYERQPPEGLLNVLFVIFDPKINSVIATRCPTKPDPKRSDAKRSFVGDYKKSLKLIIEQVLPDINKNKDRTGAFFEYQYKTNLQNVIGKRNFPEVLEEFLAKQDIFPVEAKPFRKNLNLYIQENKIKIDEDVLVPAPILAPVESVLETNILPEKTKQDTKTKKIDQEGIVEKIDQEKKVEKEQVKKENIFVLEISKENFVADLKKLIANADKKKIVTLKFISEIDKLRPYLIYDSIDNELKQQVIVDQLGRSINELKQTYKNSFDRTRPGWEAKLTPRSFLEEEQRVQNVELQPVIFMNDLLIIVQNINQRVGLSIDERSFLKICIFLGYCTGFPLHDLENVNETSWEATQSLLTLIFSKKGKTSTSTFSTTSVNFIVSQQEWSNFFKKYKTLKEFASGAWLLSNKFLYLYKFIDPLQKWNYNAFSYSYLLRQLAKQPVLEFESTTIYVKSHLFKLKKEFLFNRSFLETELSY
jgi:hypothetical protein